MRDFCFDAGILTVTLLAFCALRTRVSISAIGSCKLISVLLPACLDQARDIATHGGFTDLVAAQAKFTVNTMGSSGHAAAVLLSHRGGIAWQFLQFFNGSHLFVVSRVCALDDLPQLAALLGVLRHQAGTFQFTLNHGSFSHNLNSSNL